MDADLGLILDEARKDEEQGKKGTLALCLRQGRRAMRIKKLMPKEWKQALMDATGLKKSTHYDRLSIVMEFGPMLIEMESKDHGGIVLFKDYENITPSALKILLKVCKGTSDEVKHAYLEQAATLSYSDLKKLVEEKLGKEVHECGPLTETVAWKCQVCGKLHKKEGAQ